MIIRLPLRSTLLVDSSTSFVLPADFFVFLVFLPFLYFFVPVPPLHYIHPIPQHYHQHPCYHQHIPTPSAWRPQCVPLAPSKASSESSLQPPLRVLRVPSFPPAQSSSSTSLSPQNHSPKPRPKNTNTLLCGVTPATATATAKAPSTASTVPASPGSQQNPTPFSSAPALTTSLNWSITRPPPQITTPIR